MIVEERIYTLHPGKVPEYMKLYEEEGRAAQEPILGKMVGWYYTCLLYTSPSPRD